MEAEMEPEAELLKIGEVAQQAGVATSALRYYDDLGLVQPAHRTSGQRRYTAQAVTRLRIIEQCQTAGFSLEETSQLLDGADDWHELARSKLDELTGRIQELEDAKRLVEAALACGCTDVEGCGRQSHALSRLERDGDGGSG
jgi:DNA-binding transcriptional MerR regulator